MASRSAPMDSELNDMSFQDLDILRRRVTSAQNIKNPLLRLPAELRNRIWRLACLADLEKQLNIIDTRAEIEQFSSSVRESTPSLKLRPPYFLNACRQMKQDVEDVLYNDIMVWEEYLHQSKKWRKLNPEEVSVLLSFRSPDGPELKVDSEVSKTPGGLIVRVNDTRLNSSHYRIGVIRLAKDLGRLAISWNIGRGSSNVALLC